DEGAKIGGVIGLNKPFCFYFVKEVITSNFTAAYV
ncbi:MAG: hypothetical protein K0R82_2370, partial [Flavipsychrobacter sp.]|nr:hypothetical protein [Flavipsychrobacter sp.]